MNEAESVTRVRHLETMQRDQDILDIALGQGGVIRRDQALEKGFDDAAIQRRIATGTWQSAGHRGYRLVQSPGKLNLVRAAIAVLPNAVVSHNSAAAMHKLSLVPTDVVSVSVHSRTTHAFPSVKVYRNHDLQPNHLTLSEGLPITSIARTLVDLGAILSPRHLAVIVDDAIANDACSLEDVQAVLDDVARRGKPGTRKMRSILEDRIGEPRDGTVLERHGMALLVEAGITGCIQEYSLPWSPQKRFDLAFPDQRIAIEWDSRRWHAQMEAMRSDRARDREAIEHGWRILRFTWADVHDSPDLVIATVRSVLAY